MSQSYLRADSSGLVWCDHHVGRHKEGSVLSRRDHVVRLVPDPLVHRVEPGRHRQPQQSLNIKQFKLQEGIGRCKKEEVGRMSYRKV